VIYYLKVNHKKQRKQIEMLKKTILNGENIDIIMALKISWRIHAQKDLFLECYNKISARN
jgi:hypothetical protein